MYCTVMPPYRQPHSSAMKARDATRLRCERRAGENAVSEGLFGGDQSLSCSAISFSANSTWSGLQRNTRAPAGRYTNAREMPVDV